MAAMLASTGIRSSEALNAFVSDFEFRDGNVHGYLRHPEFHMEQWGQRSCTRRYLLKTLYGLQPRPALTGSQRAGWKGMLLQSDNSAEIFWSPLPGVRELFAALLSDYLLDVRPSIMARRFAAGHPDHPYLLVCAEAADASPEGAIGRPYTMAAASHSWHAAIARLSRLLDDPTLVPGKHAGTTLHGLRHLYGYTLAKSGFTESEIQKCMHHRSILSSRVYTAQAPEDIHALLEDARLRIREQQIVPFDMGRLSLGEALDGLATRRFHSVPRDA
ncbi:hypothetical protein [Antarcticirhabdus aurantiaca]|uniref:Uncharacterized protein n=1 Tax=Antarcticirhabdus aurantiaca TaxID=2606717 RepID=A0ACD4NPW4_9HYPH|nr:hypothetical protein [Antarcticirhabdus aurantiaca]WAJ28905.1 hypothetical protein OXU80_01220 [Jeongeuplla avenae]